MLIRFNTRDKKPNLYNIFYLFIFMCIVCFGLWFFKTNNYIEWISVANFLFFAFSFIFLLNAFVRQLQYNPYSYNTIFYIGFLFFVAFINVTYIYIMMQMVQRPEYLRLHEIIHILLRSAYQYIVVTSIFLIPFAIGLFISNIMLIHREGYRFVNILAMILAFLIVVGLGLVEWVIRSDQIAPTQNIFLAILINTFPAIYLYFECMIFGTIVANIMVSRYVPDFNQDYMIILGCGLQKDGSPTPLLKGRIDCALNFYHQQLTNTGKELRFICSGGQGEDEVCSEAKAMQRYLLGQGIQEANICLEEASGSTHENMLFSKEMIEKEKGYAHVAFATSNFHVFRAGLKARQVKLKALGIGAVTKWYFWPNATVREFVGLLTEHKIKQALILLGLLGIYTSLTILFFL